MIRSAAIALALGHIAAPVQAEILSASAHGLHLRNSIELAATQDTAFAAIGRIAEWWNPDHTYSGNSTNLSLALRPGGCFCERLAGGGGIEHLRVVYVDPGKRVVLAGSLGPLLYEATSGVLDMQIEKVAGGSRVTIDYKVAGFAQGSGEKLAGPVNAVIAEQLKRYQSFVPTLATAR